MDIKKVAHTRLPSVGFRSRSRFLTACRWHTHTHTHTRLTALFLGVPRSASTSKVKPIWILLEQETVSGSGISWAICKSAPRSRQITTPAPHHSVFYEPDALPAAQPTASKHWRQYSLQVTWIINPTVGCHYFPPGLQLPSQPLRGLLPILITGEQRLMGVNSLPKTVTRQRRDCDLNPGPSPPESSTLTTRLPSHPRILHITYYRHKWIVFIRDDC